MKEKKLIEVLGLEPDKDGFYQTQWGKKTEVGLIETIKNILTPETTKERFFEMLEVLPPESWIHGENWEMFQVGEASDGNAKGFRYATFLRIGENYWELGDHNKIGTGRKCKKCGTELGFGDDLQCGYHNLEE